MYVFYKQAIFRAVINVHNYPLVDFTVPSYVLLQEQQVNPSK